MFQKSLFCPLPIATNLFIWRKIKTWIPTSIMNYRKYSVVFVGELWRTHIDRLLVWSVPFCLVEFILWRMRLGPVFPASVSTSGKYDLCISRVIRSDYIALKRRRSKTKKGGNFSFTNSLRNFTTSQSCFTRI